MHAHDGVAGAVYLISRLARCGVDIGPVLERFRSGVAALTEYIRGETGKLPGLNFGKAGIGVAFAEAFRAGLVDEDCISLLGSCRSSKLDWPDLTHGAAGQGIAALYCNELVPNSEWLRHAALCTQYLLREQDSGGLWQLPEGVDGMSGDLLTGFAHGAAGILYFLSRYERRIPDERVRAAIFRAEEALLKLSHTTTAGGLTWPYSVRRPNDIWSWWCHGSPGIALAYLSLFETTGTERFADTARGALRAIPEEIPSANLSQCHGLAGLGEIYIEAARILGEACWQVRADPIARRLMGLARPTRRGIVWPVEKAGLYTAALMLGCSGIIHFLARYAFAHREWGPPLLLGASSPSA